MSAGNFSASRAEILALDLELRVRLWACRRHSDLFIERLSSSLGGLAERFEGLLISLILTLAYAHHGQYSYCGGSFSFKRSRYR